jgi:hypothetical protein
MGCGTNASAAAHTTEELVLFFFFRQKVNNEFAFAVAYFVCFPHSSSAMGFARIDTAEKI